MTPIENIKVKIMPIAASFLILMDLCNQVINNAAIIPARTEPPKNAEVEYPKKTNATTIPGRMACDRASPINDMFLKTMKLPNNPHKPPTNTEAIKALTPDSSKKNCCMGSKIDCITK